MFTVSVSQIVHDQVNQGDVIIFIMLHSCNHTLTFVISSSSINGVLSLSFPELLLHLMTSFTLASLMPLQPSKFCLMVEGKCCSCKPERNHFKSNPFHAHI